MSTYVALIEDLLEGCYRSGFRRIVLVNGHGGNAPVMTLATEWLDAPARCQREDAQLVGRRRSFQAGSARQIDPAASHASWMENFPVDAA